RPRHTHGRPSCRAGARRSSGSASGAASRADGDEPAAREQRLAAAELLGEPVRVEVALVDLPARAVVEDPLLTFLGLDVLAQRGVDDDELGSEPAGIGEEALAVCAFEVAVEVAGEDAAEARVLEGKVEGVALDELRFGRLAPRLLEHRRALVEADNLAGEVAREEARAAGDVERSRGG